MAPIAPLGSSRHRAAPRDRSGEPQPGDRRRFSKRGVAPISPGSRRRSAGKGSPPSCANAAAASSPPAAAASGAARSAWRSRSAIRSRSSSGRSPDPLAPRGARPREPRAPRRGSPSAPGARTSISPAPRRWRSISATATVARSRPDVAAPTGSRPQDRRDLLADLLEIGPGSPRRDRPRRLPRPRSAAGDVALRFFYYPYPLVEPLDGEGLAVASPLDLGLMKLGAIISRGARRDFVDLYLLCRELPLGELLRARGGEVRPRRRLRAAGAERARRHRRRGRRADAAPRPAISPGTRSRAGSRLRSRRPAGSCSAAP